MMNDPETSFPEEVAAIERCGYVVFVDESLPADFRERFDAGRIPVTAIRHVRQWGLQVDDEFELAGHERTTIPDEELWEVSIRARDGSSYEVNSALLRPAPG
ncbi:MAG: hypothetical protein OEU50_15430 [Gammaproteobacteria bacterium]|nr:hypothetical protein [Gammaproteobacteria bacterium]